MLEARRFESPLPRQVPFRIAFRAVEHLGRPYLVANELIDGALLLDIAVRFCTAYVNKKSVLVHDLPHIAKHYLGSQFTVDQTAAFPLDLIMWAGYRSTHPGPYTPPWPFMAWLRLTKLLRVIRLYQHNRSTEDKSTNSVTAHVLRLTFFLLVIMHYLACIVWFIGRVSRESTPGHQASAQPPSPRMAPWLRPHACSAAHQRPRPPF